METTTLRVETRGRVGIVTLHRPEALNALSSTLLRELSGAVRELDASEAIGCIVVTGSERAFAAGADIAEMAERSVREMSVESPLAEFESIQGARTPLVAAVAGYALGGGCELAMACDIVIAADTARFGQPEITLGVIPGLGGTQRLPRAIGYAKAAELVLTGRSIDAAEAERIGLVSRVVAADALLDEALAVAETIASKSLPVVYAAKEALRASQEGPLAEGLRFERRVFASLFALEDQREGMAAFLEKRAPEFRHR